MSEAKEKTKKKGLNPLIIVIVVLVLIIIGLAAYFLVLKKPSTQAASPYVAAQAEQIKTATWSAGDFIVNLADTDADRYLKTTVVLGYDSTDSEVSKTMEEEKAQIRDCIIGVIISKKKADIGTQKGIETLKSDIAKKVNEYLKEDKIIHVYFSDVLIQ